jgi:hypothetical protein
MGDINLNIVGEQTFGARLPTVFIQSLEISDLTVGGVTTPDPASCNVKAVLTIKFTKPATLELSSTSEFVSEYLDNLMLYTSITTDDTSFADALNNENLNLLEWHKHVQRFDERGAEGTIEIRHKLKDLIAGDAEAALILSNSYDGNGNEIIEISNIICEFAYEGHADAEYGTGDYLLPLNQVSSVYFFAAVGLNYAELTADSAVDTDDDGSEADYVDGSGMLLGKAKTSSNQTYNTFFGNITYYHLMDLGVQSSRFYRQYSLPDGTPYLNNILQSINGKFYSTEGYGYPDIKLRIEALTNSFSTERTTNMVLNRNISNLEAIVLAENNRTNMLGEMVTYRATYPNKDQATASGRFFNSFVVAFSEILTSVQSQTELTQKLYLDTLLVDLRVNQLGGSFTYPPTLDYIAGSWGDPSDDYIPTKWFQINRYARNVKDLADTIYSGSSYMDLDDDSEIKIERATGEGETEYFVEYERVYQQFKDDGLSDEIAEQMAHEEMEYLRDRSGATDALALFDLTAGYGLTNEKNFVVHNKGIFFFDYEKAVRTKSIASKAINLTKVQQYFRRAPAYKHYYVKEASITRKEAFVGASAGSSDNIKCTIFADFEIQPGYPLAGQYMDLPVDGEDPLSVNRPSAPAQYSVGLKWQVTKTSGTAIEDIDLYKFNYMRPMVNDASDDDGADSLDGVYLKIKHFDVMNGDPSKRLDGFNDLSVLSSYADAGSVYDGYRLMCFEFSDFMDDDIAYYNATQLGTDEASDERKDTLASFNSIDAERTVYKIHIKCVDNTKRFLRDLYDHLKDIYDEYVEYTEFAEEICAFNNITNSYNQFFIEAITEQYASTAPWARAAYAFTALADILYNQEQTSPDILNYMVMDRLSKISPSTGTLIGTVESAVIFENLLKMIGPNSSVAAYNPSPIKKVRCEYGGCGLESTGEHTYFNEIDFGARDYGEIAGNFYPDMNGAEEISVREVAPFLVIPEKVFMGGRSGGDITTSSDETATSLPDSGFTMENIWAGVVGETAVRTFSRSSLDSADSSTLGSYADPYSTTDTERRGFRTGESGDYSYDFGTSVDSDSWTAYIDILDPFTLSTQRIAYEEVFLPYSTDDWRWELLDIRLSGLGSIMKDTNDESVHDLLSKKPTVHASIGSDPATSTFSNAAKLAHEILMRSSTDTLLNADGTKAKRRGSNNWVNGRRDDRQLSDLAYLLKNVYLVECDRRLDHEDPEMVSHRYSLIVRQRQNAAGMGWGTMAARDADFGSAIHERIRTVIEKMLLAVESELAEPTMDSSGYSGYESAFTQPIARLRDDFTFGDTNGTSSDPTVVRGMASVVSYHDYPGIVKAFVEYED